MPKLSDEILIAYLDGELDDAERRRVEGECEADPSERERLAQLASLAAMLRDAFAEILDEPVPERLIAAARGAATAPPEAEILAFAPTGPGAGRGAARRSRAVRPLLWRLGVPIAASLASLLVGGGIGFYDGRFTAPASSTETNAIVAAADNDSWLDNAAGYYKLMIKAGDHELIDVPASANTQAALQKISQSVPGKVRFPDLKPWALNFIGARLAVFEGRPAAQLVYTTDNKAIGPLTLLIGSTKEPDIAPTYARRQNVNLLYWRHQGRAYVLSGEADIGYLWGIANDIAWQLDAI
jgi:anti-sigma factor RsiW